MIYLYVEKNSLKLLHLKKTLFGQYELITFEKTYQTELLTKGKILNIDYLASAVKEIMANNETIKDKEVFLILPQESFSFLRSAVPADIAQSAIGAFIRDKSRASLGADIDSCCFDYMVEESGSQKQLSFFAILEEELNKLKEGLALADLKLVGIVPETIAYYKLFEKTLRKDKKENILYVDYEKNLISGYLFDSYGLIDPEKWTAEINEKTPLEEVLKKKAVQIEKKTGKLNRLILSGAQSENIRQDTFTKNIGVWTNPLKRIIPNFYQEYLKTLILPTGKTFEILTYDQCFGAFIFFEENKTFSLTRIKPTAKKKLKIGLPKVNIPKKEILLFFISFIFSFLLFVLISRVPSINFLAKISNPPTPSIVPTAVPSPTPTPSFKKEDLKIKILNGSGIAGKAVEVRDILKEGEYQEIVTGNADNFDYEITEIQVKPSKSGAAAMIKDDLKDYSGSFKETSLDEEASADVIIIVAKDFK